MKKATPTNYAIYNMSGELEETFFSFAAARKFCLERNYYMESGGSSKYPNAQFFLRDLDTHEVIGYLGRSYGAVKNVTPIRVELPRARVTGTAFQSLKRILSGE